MRCDRCDGCDAGAAPDRRQSRQRVRPEAGRIHRDHARGNDLDENVVAGDARPVLHQLVGEAHRADLLAHRRHPRLVGAHGYTGRHNCDQGGGIGYDIKVTSCFTERLATNHINEWDLWKVYVFFEGFPISASHDMHASAWGSGNIYFYW